MERNNAIRIINKAFDRLAFELTERSRGDFNRYSDQCRVEEREHRGSALNGPNGLTVAQATRLFVVSTIVRYLDDGFKPDARDFFHLKTSHYMAYALVAEYRQHIVKAFDGFDLAEIKALDYAELNTA